MSNAFFDEDSTDDFLDSLEGAGGSGGRKAEALYLYPNVDFEMRIDRVELFRPRAKGDGKNIAGVVYYKYEGEVLGVTPRQGQGAAACTPEQKAKAEAVVGKVGSCLVQVQNRKFVAFGPNGEKLGKDEEHNAARIELTRMDDDPDTEKNGNAKNRIALMQFAFAAARSKEGKDAVPDPFNAAVDKEQRRNVVQALTEMLSEAFEGRNQEVFGGARVIVAVRQYEKKDKVTKQPNGFATASECLPLPELRG